MNIKNYLQGNPGGDFSLADRYFNDGEVELMLNDLEKEHTYRTQYFKEREACVQEIKSNQGNTYRINDMRRLLSERDYIYKKEEHYLKSLEDIQTYYLKKLDIEKDRRNVPDDLQRKLREMANNAKVEKNKLLEHKREFQIKFEQKRRRVDQNNSQRMANVANSILNPGSVIEDHGISERLRKIDQLKNDHRKTLLNDFLPEDTVLDNALNQNEINTLVNRQKNEILGGNKDREDKIRNLTALRTSLEVINNYNGSGFNKPQVDISQMFPNQSSVGINSTYKTATFGGGDKHMNSLPNLGGGDRDSIDQAMKAQKLSNLFDKKAEGLSRIYEIHPTQESLARTTSTSQKMQPQAQGDYWSDIAAKSSVRVAGDKLNRMIKEASKSVEDVRISLMVGDKHKDRSPEEDSLKRVAAMEVEMMQALSMLPYSKDMYRYKMEQLNHIAQDRRDLEQVLLENRLANQRGGNEKDPLYEERKQRIRNEIKKALGEAEEQTGEYDTKIGFDIHFDFVLELPEPHQSSQLTHGIFKLGQMVSPPQLTGIHTIEGEEDGLIRSIYGEKATMTGIISDPNTLILFELQFMNKLEQGNQAASYGWTGIDIFSDRRTLKRGRFKLPFYPSPIDISSNKERFKSLRPLAAAFLYIRINHPLEGDEETDFNYYSDLASLGYQIPPLHESKDFTGSQSMQELQKDDKIAEINEENQRLQQIIENQKERLEELGALDDSRYLQMFMGQRAIINRLNKDPFAEPDDIGMPATSTSKNRDPTPQETPKQLDDSIFDLVLKEKGPPSGLKVEILNLTELETEKPLQVSMKIFYNDQPMPDDTNEIIDHITDEKIVSIPPKKKVVNVKMTDIFKVPFYFQGLFDVLKKQKITDKSCYCLFQILRDGAEESWYIFDLQKKYKVNKGKQKAKLYPNPVGALPFDDKEYKKLKENKKQFLEFKISEEKYARDKIDAFVGAAKKVSKSKPKKEEKPKKVEAKPKKVEETKKTDSKAKKGKKAAPKKELLKKGKKEKVSKLKSSARTKNITPRDKKPKLRLDKPFIKADDPVHVNSPFEHNGIDIFVDQLRYLPYNVTAVKVIARVINKEFKDIIAPQAGLSNLENPYCSPEFMLKTELRADENDSFDHTMFLFLTYVTVDYYSTDGRPSIIGFSFFPLFLSLQGDPATREQDQVTLHDGAYQLPIYCQEYPYAKTLDMDSVGELDRIPGSSVLIRVQIPPVEEGNVLGLADVEDQADWESKGVWPPFQSYRHRTYCTKYLPNINDNELNLIDSKHKASLDEEKIFDRTKLLMEAFDENFDITWSEEKQKERILRFIDNVNFLDSTLRILDFKYLQTYQANIGFSIAVDGILQPSKNGYFLTILCINPPGSFYAEPPESDGVRLAYQIDWNSDQRCPRYLDGWIEQKGLSLDPNSHMIFIIKEVVFSNNRAAIKDYGFAMLPLLAEKRYIYTGIYQLPIFKYDLTKEASEELAKDDPWKMLLTLAGKKNPKTKKPFADIMDGCSLIIRLKDNNYEQLIEEPFEHQRMNYYFLPEQKLEKYRYDEKKEEKLKKASLKPMKDIIIKGVIPEEFNEVLRKALNDAYKLNLEDDDNPGAGGD